MAATVLFNVAPFGTALPAFASDLPQTYYQDPSAYSTTYQNPADYSAIPAGYTNGYTNTTSYPVPLNYPSYPTAQYAAPLTASLGYSPSHTALVGNVFVNFDRRLVRPLGLMSAGLLSGGGYGGYGYSGYGGYGAGSCGNTCQLPVIPFADCPPWLF